MMLLSGYAVQLLGKAWVRYVLIAVVALMLGALTLSFGVADSASARHSYATSGWYCMNAWDYRHHWACYYYSYYDHQWYGPLYPWG